MPKSFMAKLIILHDKLESIQYNACLVITSALRGTLTEKKLPRTSFRIS